jgi:hypothetical protein
MRHADVSQLAASGATGLLAAQVRGCLRACDKERLTDAQRSSLEEAKRFLESALQGLDELQRFRRELSFTQDKLDDVLHFRTAASALHGGEPIDAERESDQLRDRLATVLSHVRSMLDEGGGTGRAPEEVDMFFSLLARYEAARGRQIVGASSRSLSRNDGRRA